VARIEFQQENDMNGTSQARRINALHNPERGEDETFAAYKVRRMLSQEAVATVLAGVMVHSNDRGGHYVSDKAPSSTDRERANVAARRPARTQPKFAKARAHKQHKHPLRDEHGAYTLVGRPRGYGRNDTSELPNFGRRIWLGGISAQRGY
jgi:hypothetical protein